MYMYTVCMCIHCVFIYVVLPVIIRLNIYKSVYIIYGLLTVYICTIILLYLVYVCFVYMYVGGAGPNEVGVAGMKRYDSQVAFH